jgi:hypothetical protein
MGLTKEAILAADDLPRQKVAVPEWGGDVWVRRMTFVERLAWEGAAIKSDAISSAYVELLVRTVCDESGERLFGDNDQRLIEQRSPDAVKRLLDVALKLNPVTKAAQDDLLKNSGSGPSAASPSA